MFSKIIAFVLVCASVFFFVYSSDRNYRQHVEIKYAFVAHPEFIPESRLVHMTAGWFQNVIADSYWLSIIQYIGSNALGSEYKAYLFAMLDLVTDLSPHFTFPYTIGELLLPSYNERYENLSGDVIEKNISQAIAIGTKGIQNNCDTKKIEAIKKEFDLKKLWTDPIYENPCRDPMIPYYLGYVYYWNKHDGARASEYYKIAAANKDAPNGARIMAAIMQGKSGDREKAIIMLLSLAESIEGEKKSSCQAVSKELGSVLLRLFDAQKTLTSNDLRIVEALRIETVKRLAEENVDFWSAINADNFCSTYLNKAVREMNVAYLEQADKRYFADNHTHANNPAVLLREKYIDFIPVDFQRDEKNKQEIRYFYNHENGNWDYKMEAD